MRLLQFDHPWDPCMGLFTYMWLIYMVNVGKYTSPMDCLCQVSHRFPFYRPENDHIGTSKMDSVLNKSISKGPFLGFLKIY